MADDRQRPDDSKIRLRLDLTPVMWRAGTAEAAKRAILPEIDEKALTGFKFNEALPQRLAEATLAQRPADLDGAAKVLGERVRFVTS